MSVKSNQLVVDYEDVLDVTNNRVSPSPQPSPPQVGQETRENRGLLCIFSEVLGQPNRRRVLLKGPTFPLHYTIKNSLSDLHFEFD